MSDVSKGPGWWLASDGRWYPPHLAPAPVAPSQFPVPGVPSPSEATSARSRTSFHEGWGTVGLVAAILLAISPFFSWATGHVATAFGSVVVGQVDGTKDGRGVLTLLAGIALIVLWFVARTRVVQRTNLGLAIAFGSIAGVTFFLLLSVSADVHNASILVQYASEGSVTATLGGGLILAFLADLTTLAIGIVLIVQEARAGRTMKSGAAGSPVAGPFGNPSPANPYTTPGGASPEVPNRTYDNAYAAPAARPDAPATTCKTCHAVVSSGGAFCSNCGARQS